MMKLLFYHGPGDRVTKFIRLVTGGPYSHVELQFTDGCRFFSSGHGVFTGTHMINDRKVYDHYWDRVLIPATYEQERAAERYIFELIGIPFDWVGIVGYLVPFFSRYRKPRYCSSVVLDVLQQSLHMFPGTGLRNSPNALYRLFLSHHPLIISAPITDGDEVPHSVGVEEGVPCPKSPLGLPTAERPFSPES